MTVFSALLLPVLVGLGLWQLDRAAEKRALVTAVDSRLAAQPQDPSQLADLQRYIPVRLLGYFTDEYFYLDNRTRSGHVGYEILQVFVSGDRRWLVNRGWLPAERKRSALPEVTWPRAAKVITGFLYPVALAEDEAAASAVAGTARIQAVDSRLADTLDLAQPQWTIRLSADSDTALVTDWHLVSSSPARHLAYAWQWFAMAMALVILWLLAATRLPARLRGIDRRRQRD
ncbi:SURF1 family protein [Microbulbifer sp. YPW16]|uniref:SURF1 family protein n=1 Tax=Microbulbifer sp. YPW16 TaxID=2904242 RepID=UPI001E2C71A5|nr:SURF1 family protein [Microbulbifer sp. YPW16]UHQ54047.1 SURF1 family protein [Microbulbifer sp. YPW16]